MVALTSAFARPSLFDGLVRRWLYRLTSIDLRDLTAAAVAVPADTYYDLPVVPPGASLLVQEVSWWPATALGSFVVPGGGTFTVEWSSIETGFAFLQTPNNGILVPASVPVQPYPPARTFGTTTIVGPATVLGGIKVLAHINQNNNLLPPGSSLVMRTAFVGFPATSSPIAVEMWGVLGMTPQATVA